MAKDVLHTPVLPDVPADSPGVSPYCRDCNIDLPWAVAALAVAESQKVVDVGGTREGFFPATGSEGPETVVCTHPGAPNPSTQRVRVVQCPRCDGAGGSQITLDYEPYTMWDTCEMCGAAGIVGMLGTADAPEFVPVGLSGLDSESLKGAQVVHAPKKSPEDKARTRAAWNNFLAMREATKPSDLGEADTDE